MSTISYCRLIMIDKLPMLFREFINKGFVIMHDTDSSKQGNKRTITTQDTLDCVVMC